MKLVKKRFNRTPLFATALTLSVLGASLTGCSQQLPEVDENATSSSTDPSPDLSEKQVQDVLDDVKKVLADGDETLDAQLLSARVKKPALSMRAGFYKQAEAEKTNLPPVKFDVDASTVTQSDSWPRAIVVPTIEGEDELPKLVFITQDNPRDDYQLESWVRIFPGQSVQTAVVSAGSPVVSEDASGYVLSPKETLAHWVAKLNGDEEQGELFEDDEFVKNYNDERQSLNAALDGKGKVVFKAKAEDSALTAVQLVDGSALVSGHITYTMTYETANDRATLKIGGLPGKLSNASVKKGKPVVVTYLTTVAFKVPAKGATEKIRAIGAERSIQSIKQS